MPNIIVPNKELLGAARRRCRVVLVVSRPSTSDALVSALVDTVPALLVLVHSSSEALEVTEAIKPDAFVLESNLDALSGIELYDRLRVKPGFSTIPAILLGMSSLEQHRSMQPRKVVHLLYTTDASDLPSVLGMFFDIPVPVGI